MYLTQLEIQGFKSFAQKTVLKFPAHNRKVFPITAVVGPNGSGKSNVVDAIRWVLGEQSMKQLRGKKHEDVIFSGSDQRARLGYAEVSLCFDNSDHAMPVDLPEVVITRRLYRDGESEYLLNNRSVRLMDINMLLAQAHIGQQTYSVISQGMVEHLLLATPKERKEMIDEAAGVRPYQLKRLEAINKLSATKENLLQVQTILNEIEPRLRSLTRMVKRLERRGEIEQELERAQTIYYGRAWGELGQSLRRVQSSLDSLKPQHDLAERELERTKKELERLEQERPASSQLLSLQQEFETLNRERSKLERELWEQERVSPTVRQVMVSLEEVSASLEALTREYQRIEESLKNTKDVSVLEKLWAGFGVNLKKLSERLKPKHVAPEPVKPRDTALDGKVKVLSERIARLQETMRNLSSTEQSQRQGLVSEQRKRESQQGVLERFRNEEHALQIELARQQTRREDLAREIQREMNIEPATLTTSPVPPSTESVEQLNAQIQRLKHERELIGAIDPEVSKEYGTTKERFEFLTDQTGDLSKAIEKLESIIKDLDISMEQQFHTAFSIINRELARTFGELFGGGKATLVLLEAEEEMPDTQGDEIEAAIEKSSRNSGAIAGIDIQATPPGKRMKNVALLSGGEKALTAVALLCAILSFKPSPFVILDEVDAALDEANSTRYAKILGHLGQKTQFIVITHNRSTMQVAQTFYGVTMGADGVSQLLSLKLEEAEAVAPR